MTEIAGKNSTPTPKPDRREEMARRGLWLPAKLRKAGIRVEAGVSIEYQELAKRYVLRGKESGGANNDFGAYCGFASNDGQSLRWTQKVDTIGVNMVHAVVIAPTLVRVEILRVGHTYDLLITRHSLENLGDQVRRPKLVNEIVFHGRLGQLTLELWSRDRQFKGFVAPAFLTRSGEPLSPPEAFEEPVKQAVAGACCVGCRSHTHLLVAHGRSEKSDAVSVGSNSSAASL